MPRGRGDHRESMVEAKARRRGKGRQASKGGRGRSRQRIGARGRSRCCRREGDPHRLARAGRCVDIGDDEAM
jgi:hypothetical protein